MQGIDYTRLTIHEVIAGVDKGRIFAQEEINFDYNINNLTQSYNFISQQETKLFNDFLNGKINIIEQIDTESFYWPRLSTPLHGYINWSWSASEIVSFCAAFDQPYDGATTFLYDSTVLFSNVKKVNERFKFHPFQSGLIYRINKTGVFIATREGGLCVSKISIEPERPLRVGLRFVTPPDVMFSALTATV